MNDTIRTILERRSVRRFLPDPVAAADLELIVRAGLYAPTAKNRQPWHLVVLSGLERIKHLDAEVKAATARMPENYYKDYVGKSGYSINYHAPAFIIVAGNPGISALAEVDCATVTQNLMLAARSLGLGSCWINQLGILSDEPGFRVVLTGLGLPEGCRVYSCVAVGYPESGFPGAPARKEGTVTWHIG